jgi:hypothetical protein
MTAQLPHFLPAKRTRLPRSPRALTADFRFLPMFQRFMTETSPNRFFDCIASEIPLLVNYPGWLAKLIDRNRCGLVVPLGLF